jgi:hypothetical protein
LIVETEAKYKQNFYELFNTHKDKLSIYCYLLMRIKFKFTHENVYEQITDLEPSKIHKMLKLIEKGFTIDNASFAVSVCRSEEEYNKIFELIGRNVSQHNAINIINYEFNEEDTEKIIQMTSRVFNNGKTLSMDIANDAIDFSNEEIESMFELINQGVDENIALTYTNKPPEIKRILVHMVQHGIDSDDADDMIIEIEDEELTYFYDFIIELIDNGINTINELKMILFCTQNGADVQFVLDLLKQNNDVKGFIREINYIDGDKKFEEMIAIVKEGFPFDSACGMVLF